MSARGPRISTTTYTTICYGVCALLLLAVCLVGGVRLSGFDGRTWLAILALVAGAQLLGHSLFNYALRRISATTVSVLILLEVPGAALIAWLWLGQVPTAGQPARAWPCSWSAWRSSCSAAPTRAAAPSPTRRRRSRSPAPHGPTDPRTGGRRLELSHLVPWGRPRGVKRWAWSRWWLVVLA